MDFKAALYVPIDWLLELLFFFKDLYNFQKFWILTETLSVTWKKNLPQGLSKQLSSCPGERFEGKHWKKSLYFKIFTLWAKNWWRTLFGSLAKPAFCISTETLWEEQVCWRFLFLFFRSLIDIFCFQGITKQKHFFAKFSTVSWFSEFQSKAFRLLTEKFQ